MNPVENSTLITASLSSLRDGFVQINAQTLQLWKMSGKDAGEYLHSQVSSDIRGLPEGRGQWTTLLDRKGRLRAVAQVWKLNHHYFFIAKEDSMSALVQHLENYHFTEEFSQEQLKGEFVAIAGPKAILEIKGLKITTDGHLAQTVEDALFFVGKTLGEQVVYCFSHTPDPQLTRLKQSPQLSEADQEIARIESGEISLGHDTDEKTLVPETGLEHIAVSYDKGCYLGQEVVARMKTYGTAPKALMGLLHLEGIDFEKGLELRVGGKLAGHISSSANSPSFGKIALAYLKKDWRIPQSTPQFETERGMVKARVVMLPFYQRLDNQEEAQKLYEMALDHFAGTEEEGDNREGEALAIDLLRRAVALYPNFSNAYEALGVILARQGNLDEAISLMHHLSDLNPEEVMAQTNLSLYYMKKGLIQEAEDAKARATALQFKVAAKKAREEKELKKQEVAEREALIERMGMFKEVLEIDPDDPLANFGLGGALLQLGQAEEAIPYLRQSVTVQKDHSASYLSLGKALEAAGKLDEAKQVFTAGIAVAARKGDLMPLKEMQRRLEPAGG